MQKTIERKRLTKTRRLLEAAAALTAKQTKSRQLGVRVSEAVYEALHGAGFVNQMGSGTVASLLLSAYFMPEAIGEIVNITNADISELPKLLEALREAEQVHSSSAEALQALREHLQSEGARIAAMAMHQTEQFKTSGKFSLKLKGAR